MLINCKALWLQVGEGAVSEKLICTTAQDGRSSLPSSVTLIDELFRLYFVFFLSLRQVLSVLLKSHIS